MGDGQRKFYLFNALVSIVVKTEGGVNMKSEDASIPISFRFNLKNRSAAENEKIAKLLLKLKREKLLSNELNKCIDNYYFNTQDTQDTLADIKTKTIDEKLQILFQIFASTKEKEEKELLLNMFTVYYKNDVARLVTDSLQSTHIVAAQEILEPVQILSEKVVEEEIISIQSETKPITNEIDEDDEFSQLPNPYEKQK